MKRMIIQNVTFPCAVAALDAGIPQNAVVVMDAANPGNVKLPAATPELTAVGVTFANQNPGGNVTVQTDGIATVATDGSAVINPGDYVIASNALGQVKTHAIVAGAVTVYNIIGQCVEQKQVPATAGLTLGVRLMLTNLVAA